MNKRVLVIVQNTNVIEGVTIKNRINSLEKMGFQIDVINPKGKYYKKIVMKIKNTAYYNFPDMFFHNLIIEYCSSIFFSIFILFYLLIKNRYKIFFITSPPSFWLLFIYLLKPFKGKKIHFHNDLSPEIYFLIYKKINILYRILKDSEKIGYTKFDHVFDLSKSYKGYAEKEFNIRIDNSTVVRNAPDLKLFQNVDQLKCKGNNIYVGYIGILGNEDNIFSMLDTIDFIINTKHRTEIKLIVVGDGPILKNAITYCKEKRIQEDVIFKGRLLWDDYSIQEAVSICKLFVLPDEVNNFTQYTSQSKLMEYMALRRPIVMYRTIEGYHIAKDTVIYAYDNNYTDFAEKILYVCDNYEKCMILAEKAYERIENKFNWNYYEEIFQEKVLDILND